MDACYIPSARVPVRSAKPYAVQETNWWRQFSETLGLLQQAKQRYMLRRQQRMDREAFLNLFKLDEALLDDIGVTREELSWAADLPLCDNAALALHEIARARRKTA